MPYLVPGSLLFLRVLVYVVSCFLRLTDCVEPVAYGFLVLKDSIGPGMDSGLFSFFFGFYFRRLLMYDRNDVLHLQTPIYYIPPHYFLIISPFIDDHR